MKRLLRRAALMASWILPVGFVGNIGSLKSAQLVIREPKVLWKLRLDTLSIGAAGGVRSIERIALLNSGGIVLLDRTGLQVVVIDRSGAPIRAFARGGQGPGEFSRAVSFVVMMGDTVVVPDIANGRVNRFLISGKVVDGLALEPVGLPLWYGTDQRGTLFEAMRKLQIVNGRGLFRTSIELRQVSGGGRATASLNLGARDSLEQTRFFSPIPSVISFPGDRLLAGSGNEREVRLFSFKGELLRRLSLPITESPIPASDREFLLAHLLSNVPPAARARMGDAALNAQGFEQYYPIFTSMMYDGGGRVWLQLPATREQLERDSELQIDADHIGSGEWAVIDTVGRPQFRVRMPSGYVLKAVRFDTLVAATEIASGEVALAKLLLTK